MHYIVVIITPGILFWCILKLSNLAEIQMQVLKIHNKRELKRPNWNPIGHSEVFLTALPNQKERSTNNFTTQVRTSLYTTAQKEKRYEAS